LDQLHCCLGHISPDVARRLAQNGFITGLCLKSCVYVKATWKPVAKAQKGECAMEFGGKIHSDLWGPALVATKGGKHYYVMYVNDSTHLTNLHLLAKKSDAPDAYKEYEAWCETQLKKHIQVLHSDHGSEYMGKET